MAARAISLLIVSAIVGYTAVRALPTCTTMASNVTPCAPYLTDMAAAPPRACRDGVKKLLDMAGNKADRQGICKCLKSQAANIHNLNTTRVSELPAMCDVKVPVPLGPNIDCDK